MFLLSTWPSHRGHAFWNRRLHGRKATGTRHRKYCSWRMDVVPSHAENCCVLCRKKQGSFLSTSWEGRTLSSILCRSFIWGLFTGGLCRSDPQLGRWNTSPLPNCFPSLFPGALSEMEFGNFHYATWNLFCHRGRKTWSVSEITVYSPFFFNQTGFRSEYNKEFSKTPLSRIRNWVHTEADLLWSRAREDPLNDGSDANQSGS